MVNYFLDRLLPQSCLLCGMDASGQGIDASGRVIDASGQGIDASGQGIDASGRGICAPCLAELPLIQHPCPLCALPLAVPDALACGRCLTDPPPWHRCVSAVLYEAPASRLIAALKYRSRLPVARLLAELLAAQIGPLPQVDVIVPVPLHWRRRWQRGFNQAEIIADELGRRLHLPVQTRWLQRRHTTPAQQTLSAAERARNLRGAFVLRQTVADRRIALVDDVVTTGNTATEISQLLLQQGAASVEIWSLARTPL